MRIHFRPEGSGVEIDAVLRAASDDVAAFGETLGRLRADVPAEGRPDLELAAEAYDAARASLGAFVTADDARPVAESLAAGHDAMARVRARVEGRPLPKRRPPCFIDPAHGSSVSDVTWTPPPATIPRPVPVCGADAAALAAGSEVATREIAIGSERVPYWQAGPAFSPWVVGYFGSYAVLPALVAGTSVAGALTEGEPLPHEPSDYDGLDPRGGGIDPTGGSRWDVSATGFGG
jgi:hypothetical protein